jgi:hypothetical protein
MKREADLRGQNRKPGMPHEIHGEALVENVMMHLPVLKILFENFSQFIFGSVLRRPFEIVKADQLINVRKVALA